MASNDEDLCTSHADFAVICSFVEKFGEKLGLTLPNIGELQSSLEDTDNVSPIVSQCVSQLLRRINKSVKLDRWERGLQRFAHSYSHQDGWELERFGFKKAKLEVKIRVLKTLLEAQFDLYKSFKDKVNSLSANELRLQPCGRDKKGVSYWCQLDECANLRVYSDDQDEETWTLVASTREELVTLIAELESESPPGASREMSVEGSHSGTVTPMGLSEAPTPVDSKAPTPVGSKAPTPVPSGRTSPVIDTGQDKENDKKEKVDEKKILTKEGEEESEGRVTQKLEVEKEMSDVGNETSLDTECKLGKEKKPGEVVNVKVKDKEVLDVSQSEAPKEDFGKPEKSSTKLSPSSEEVEEKQIRKEAKTQELSLKGEGRSTQLTLKAEEKKVDNKTEERKVDTVTDMEIGNETDIEKLGQVAEKEGLKTEREAEKGKKKTESPSETEKCVKENTKKETSLKTEIVESTNEKTDKMKTEAEKEAEISQIADQKINKDKNEGERAEVPEKAHKEMDKVKSEGEKKAEIAENCDAKADKVMNEAEKKPEIENSDKKTDKAKSEGEKKEETAGGTDMKPDKVKSEGEQKAETIDKRVSNSQEHESEKHNNKSKNKGEDKEGKEEASKGQVEQTGKVEAEGIQSQKGLQVDQQKTGSAENVTEITEKKADEGMCGKKSGKMPEPMEVDDDTKGLCLDIAAKKTMLVRERGSQEGSESKGPKFGLAERTEPKKKESVWDKLNKMKEKVEAKTEEAAEKKMETISCLPLSADKHPKEEEKQEQLSHNIPAEDTKIKPSTNSFSFQRAWEDKTISKPAPSVPSESGVGPSRQQQAPKLMSIESLVGPSIRPPSSSISQPAPAVIRSSTGGLPSSTKDNTTEPPLKKFKFSDMSSLESHSESRASDFTSREAPPSDPPPPPQPPPLPQAAKEGKDCVTQEQKKDEKVESLPAGKVVETRKDEKIEHLPPVKSTQSEVKDHQKDNDAKSSTQSENLAQDKSDKGNSNSKDEKNKEASGNSSHAEDKMTKQEKESMEVNKTKSKDHTPTTEATSKVDAHIPDKVGKIDGTTTSDGDSKMECHDGDSLKPSMHKSSENPPLNTKEDCGNETIEEPVMLIKGDGEGAACEAGNDPYHTVEPWWEYFDENDSTKGSVGETIEEDVMYFWGEGAGAECEAGNNGDETETNSEANKQGEGGGSGGTVATEGQRNTSAAELKPSKEMEDIKPDGEVKAVDGMCEGDEAKVNGLRTVESVEKTEKSTSQEEQSEDLADTRHASVNGKKVNEENSVGDEHRDGLPAKVNSPGCEKVKEEKKEENAEQILDGTQDSKNCKANVSGGMKVEGDEVKSSKEGKIKKETVKDKSGSEEEEDEGEEEEMEEEEEVEAEEEEEEEEDEEEEEEEENEDEEEEERNKKKSKGKKESSHGRKQDQHDSAVGQQGAKRGRGRPHKRSVEQQESDQEEDEQDENDPNEDNDEPEGDERESGHAVPPAKKRRQRGKGSTARPLPDVPRQKSARIAKIREKEEQERRELEAIRLKQLAEENRMREIKRKAREERRSQREMKKGRREKKEKKDREKKKRKKKKRGKKKKNSNDPWAHSSTSSSSSSEEEEEDMEEDEEDEKLVFKSDHEFSPESDIEEDAQPIKRARTAKKLTSESEVEEEGDEEEEEEEDETQCTKCGHDDHPETILLCDNCDAGWHLSCLRPPLLSVPEGDWVCPTCEHVQLVNKLRALLQEFDECQKRAQNEELRRQRLAYVNVSLSNVLPEGKKKKKHRDGEEYDDDENESDSDSDDDDSDSESDDSSDSSSQSSSDSTAPLYTLRARSARTLKEQVENFDEMINEAIRDEMEAAAGAGNAGRGKDIENIMQANEEEMVENEGLFEEEEEVGEPEDKESKEVVPPVTKEECEGKREREKDEDEDEVAPKRKKSKPTEEGSGDDDNYRVSEEDQADSDSEEDIKISRRPYVSVSIKKRRRLTDLDAEDDDDASDEDFMNTSEEEEDETEESLESSSSITTDLESDDSDVVDMKRRRSGRYENLPLRRSARNRRGRFGDEDSENEERIYKKQKNKKKKKRKHSSSEEEEESSDSDGSYRKKKVRRRKKPPLKPRGKRGSKGKSRKKVTKAKPKPKKETSGDGGENKKPAKPRIKYAKPPKSKQDEDEEEVSQRRVTRGRQVNYYDALMMSDETEEEEPKKKWRGKVMKGERVPTESSEYEASDDERMKRRGVSGGLGKGKVMKGEEEDEEKLEKGKKKRGRPKKGEELLGKPSILKVAALDSTPAPAARPVQSLPSVSLPITKIDTVAPVIPTVTQTAVTSAPPVQVTPSILSAAITSPSTGVPTPPATALPISADSPSHNTPEPAAGTPPTTPAPAAPSKALPATITPAAANIGSSSPIHQPVGKWSPHLSGVGGTPSTPPRSGGAPGAATPPRPGLPAAPVTASPPPPYRSSPLPMTQGGPGIPPCSSTPSSITPGGPPPTTSALSQVYAPYRPPPEHFPAHPAFPGYAPPGRHSPSPHTTSRHPAHLPPGHPLPRMPPNYGPPPLTSVPGQGPYPSRGISSHPGVLRGPPHELYRAPPGSLPGHGSPSHPGHPHLIMKPSYPGLEPLPYSGSPGPSPLSLHQGSQGSPAHHSASEDSKEEMHPSGKGPGEFSSGLMSYFSSQRDDDIE